MPTTPQVQFVKAMDRINKKGLTTYKFGKYEIVSHPTDGDRVVQLYHYGTLILTLFLDRGEAQVSIFSRSDADAINSVLRIHGYASAASYGPVKGADARDVPGLKVEEVPTHLHNPYGLL